MEGLKSFLSGGFGGMCLVFVGHPLDTVKVRLQTSSEYNGMIDCFQKSVKKEGLRGLYRGASAPLIAITPIFSVYFWGFDLGKQIARRFEGKSPDQKLSPWGTMFAGGFSAIPGSAVMVPGERLKVLLQIQGQSDGPPKYNGLLDCFQKVVKEEGILGLYRGTMLTLLRDVPGSVAYYAAYDLIKEAVTPTNSQAGPLTFLFCGGMAGVCNWLVSVPPDVLKSRYQVAPPGTYPGGLVQVFQELVQKEGLGSLYKGLGPALTRAFPANAACFLGVETSKKVLNTLF